MNPRQNEHELPETIDLSGFKISSKNKISLAAKRKVDLSNVKIENAEITVAVGFESKEAKQYVDNHISKIDTILKKKDLTQFESSSKILFRLGASNTNFVEMFTPDGEGIIRYKGATFINSTLMSWHTNSKNIAKDTILVEKDPEKYIKLVSVLKI